MGTWIYEDTKRGVWQVKQWNENRQRAEVLKEFPTRSEAWVFSAYGEVK